MLDGLPVDWIGPTSGWAVVALFVVAILTGRLVPRATVKLERELLTQRAEDWKATAQLTEHARSVQAAQLDEILVALRAQASGANNHQAAAAPSREAA